MAVGPQHDLGLWPIRTDLADYPTQMCADFDAFRPARWAQHRGNEPAVTIEHDDRLETVFVIMSIEQPELLFAMHRVKRIVPIKRDPLRNLTKRTAVEIDHRP